MKTNNQLTARQYAQLRANETGTAYIVSGWDDLNGRHERALWDCPDNRKAIELLGDTLYFVAQARKAQ
jgi:hypothetical protein